MSSSLEANSLGAAAGEPERSPTPTAPAIATTVLAMVALPTLALAAGVLPLFALAGEAAYWTAIAGAAVAAIVAIRLGQRLGAGRTLAGRFLAAALLAVAFLTPLLAFEFTRNALLAERGEEAAAVVETRHAQGGRTGTTYFCTLTHLDGTPIQPRIVERPWLSVRINQQCEPLREGQQVQVTYDPDGMVPPQIGDPDPNVLVIVGPVSLLAGLVLLTAVRARARARHGSTHAVEGATERR